MANYELPQVRVFQDLEPNIEPSERAMLPVMIGSVRDIIRYSETSLDLVRAAEYGVTSERELGALGEYDGSQVDFEWPTLAASSVVDESTVRVYGEDVMVGIQKAAFVEDAPALSPLHSTFDTSLYLTALTDGQENVVIFNTDPAVAATVNLNGSSFHRAPEVGDYIKVRQTSQDTTGQLTAWTAQVIDLVETLNAASISPPVEDDSNALDETANDSTAAVDGTTVVPGDGASTKVDYKILDLTTLAAMDPTNYGPYTELVTDKACSYGLFNVGSSELDYSIRILDVTETQVTLSITSRFYNDSKTINVSEFVANPDDTERVWVYDNLGTPTFNIATVDGRTGLPLGGLIIDDMFLLYAEGKTDPAAAPLATEVPVKNDRFDLDGSLKNVRQLYNGLAAESGGDDTPEIVTGSEFDSDTDTTYQIEVISGGAKDLLLGAYQFDPTIQLRVSSTNYLDPVQVVTADINPDGSIEFNVGTKGITVKFNSTFNATVTSQFIALARGDLWSIDCIGRSADQLVGVVTDANFPYYASDSATQRLDFEILQEVASVNIPKVQVDDVANWDLLDDGSGISMNVLEQIYMTFTVSTTPLVQVQAEAFISSATLFAEYEADNKQWENFILTVTQADDVRIGIDDPKNPIGYAVRKALLNSRGGPVLAIPVSDLEIGIDTALTKLSNNNNAYQLVPLTFDTSVQTSVIAHALSMSTELMDRWRVAYITTDVGSEYPVVDTDAEGNDVTASFVEGTSGLYNKVTIDGSVSGVSFVDSQVRAGNIVRFNYGPDMYGNMQYDEMMVTSVLTNDSLLVLGDYGAASASMKIEVHRDTLADDVIERVGGRSDGLNTRRAMNIFPSYAVDENDEVVPAYFVAAALAGLASGGPPHQGLTNVNLLGFSGVDSLAPMTTMDIVKLNELAGEGVLIVHGDNGGISVRHELTTCMLDRKNREVMITRNLDSLSYQFLDALSPFIGIANVTPEFIEKLRTEIKAMTGYIISTSQKPLIGSQMISCAINSIDQNPVLSDKVDMYLSPLLPYPFNYCDLHLQI